MILTYAKSNTYIALIYIHADCTTNGTTTASLISTGSSISNKPNGNRRKNTKQDPELSEDAIGLISAMVIITIAIISLTGYLVKAKCMKR